jgi:hypothetical protein
LTQKKILKNRQHQSVGYSWKKPSIKLNLLVKKAYKYRKKNKQAISELPKKISRYDHDILVYVEEAAIDKTIDYPYRYCHQSERFMAEKLGHKTEILSIIIAWRDGEIIAPVAFEGYCNSQLVCHRVMFNPGTAPRANCNYR